eukprot:7390055-Prymnesium_polylepis.1
MPSRRRYCRSSSLSRTRCIATGPNGPCATVTSVRLASELWMKSPIWPLLARRLANRPYPLFDRWRPSASKSIQHSELPAANCWSASFTSRLRSPTKAGPTVDALLCGMLTAIVRAAAAWHSRWSSMRFAAMSPAGTTPRSVLAATDVRVARRITPREHLPRRPAAHTDVIDGHTQRFGQQWRPWGILSGVRRDCDVAGRERIAVAQHARTTRAVAVGGPPRVRRLHHGGVGWPWRRDRERRPRWGGLAWRPEIMMRARPFRA